MNGVQEMLRDGATLDEVLVTMPERDPIEQQLVWREGLQTIAHRLAAAANRSARTVLQRVSKGQIIGLFYDPLETTEEYVKQELRRSRSREEGERKLQTWLMDILVMVGEARAAGCTTLVEYPAAAAMMHDEDDEEEAT